LSGSSGKQRKRERERRERKRRRRRRRSRRRRRINNRTRRSIRGKGAESLPDHPTATRIRAGLSQNYDTALKDMTRNY
jgi:hypothetical protein